MEMKILRRIEKTKSKGERGIGEGKLKKRTRANSRRRGTEESMLIS